MSYRVEFVSSARREFLALPRALRIRIGARIDRLADNPRPPGARKLTGEENLWRIRIGQYRVIYAIEDVPKIVAIVRVAHRRESYRGL
jgi:mRNA interferase RelE/StbE